MLKRRTVWLGMLLAYAPPYVFWGMYGDAVYRTMAGYLPLLVCMGLLCWLAFRTGNIPVLLAGNGVSFLSSYGFVRVCFPALQWSWYFKPFYPLGFLTAVSVAMLLVQGILMCLLYVRKTALPKGKDEEEYL